MDMDVLDRNLRRWLAEGQRGEIGTKQPPAEVPLDVSGLGWRAPNA